MKSVVPSSVRKLCLFSAAAWALMPSPLLAETVAREPEESERQLIADTIDFCFDPPKDVDLATDTLARIGWRSADASDGSMPDEAEALIGAILVGRFQTDDIPGSIANAGFIAASVLGNSSLGSDQIGMAYEDAVIAAMGIEERTPYCALSGPAWVVIAASQAGLNFQMEQSTAMLSQAVGVNERGFYQMGLFSDPEKIVDAAVAMAQSTSDNMQDEDSIRRWFNPAALVIYPLNTAQELLSK